MPGVVRKTDIDSGGHVNIMASQNVITNGLPTARNGDIRPRRTSTESNVGIHNVIVNNAYIQVCGDPTSGGCCQCQCSPNVHVNTFGGV